MYPLSINIKQLGLWYVEVLSKLKLCFTQRLLLYGRWSQLCEAAFTPRGDSTNCNSRVSLQHRVPRH